MKPVSFLPPYSIIRIGNQKHIVYETKKNITISKLASEIKLAPSTKLKEIAYTDELLQCWDDLRLQSLEIGQRFLFKAFNWDISEFESNLNASDKRVYRLLDSVSERYLAIYKLIKYTYPKIKKKIIACPSSPEKLFLLITDWELSNPFEILVERNYIEFNSNEMKSNIRKMKEFNNDENISVSKMKRYQKSIPTYLRNKERTPWIEILTKINAIDDSKVRLLGGYYNNAYSYFLESAYDVSDSRNNDGTKLLKSIICEDGCFRYMCKK